MDSLPPPAGPLGASQSGHRSSQCPPACGCPGFTLPLGSKGHGAGQPEPLAPGTIAALPAPPSLRPRASSLSSGFGEAPDSQEGGHVSPCATSHGPLGGVLSTQCSLEGHTSCHACPPWPFSQLSSIPPIGPAATPQCRTGLFAALGSLDGAARHTGPAGGKVLASPRCPLTQVRWALGQQAKQTLARPFLGRCVARPYQTGSGWWLFSASQLLP